MILVSASASVTENFPSWMWVFVAADLVALFIGIVWVAWRAWQTSQNVSRRLDDLSRSLTLVAGWMEELVERQAPVPAEGELVAAVARNVVVGKIEIFDAREEEQATGVGVFTVHNVGGEAVFVLGATRTAADETPPGSGRLLMPGLELDEYLHLGPGERALDLEKVTIWYRDLRGRRWARCIGDPHATEVSQAAPAPEVEEAVQVPDIAAAPQAAKLSWVTRVAGITPVPWVFRAVKGLRGNGSTGRTVTPAAQQQDSQPDGLAAGVGSGSQE
jgi:hypothetical protein